MLRLIVNRIAYTHARPHEIEIHNEFIHSARDTWISLQSFHSIYVQISICREIYDGNGEPTRLNEIEIVYYSYIRNNKIEQILFIRIVYHSAHVDQS